MTCSFLIGLLLQLLKCFHVNINFTASILVPMPLVDPILNVLSVDKDRFVDVSEDLLETPIAGV